MTNWKVLGILLIVFGVVTLAGSAFIYSYQMSQDGDIVYENGNWYELQANPQVISLMTAGMIVGGSCILIGIISMFAGNSNKVRPIDPRQQDRYATQQSAGRSEAPRAHKYPVTVVEQGYQPETNAPVNFCQGCGRKIVPGATFCEGCGRRLV